MMENTTLAWGILLGIYAFLQLVLTGWSWLRSRSVWVALATLLLPFAGLPWILWMERETVKDNQVAGTVTYLGIILGIVWFLWRVPLDERPWMVIYSMQIFAALSVANILDLSVAMRIRKDGRESA